MFYRRQNGPDSEGGGSPPAERQEPVLGRETPPPYRPGGSPPAGVSGNLVKVLVATIFVAGCAALVFGERGLMDVRRSRKELREVQAVVKEKKAAVDRLRQEVERLNSDPTALERVAREELNLAKPGEVIILLPRDPNWGKPPDTVP